PLGALPLSGHGQGIIFDPEIDGIVVQSRHIEIEVITFVILDYINRRTNAAGPCLWLKLVEESVHSVEQPAVSRKRALVPDFHLVMPPAGNFRCNAPFVQLHSLWATLSEYL